MCERPVPPARVDGPAAPLLGGEPVAWLVQRARDRLEAGRPLTGTVTLPAATVGAAARG